MFSWMKQDESRKNTDVYDNVTAGLQEIYRTKLLPLEKEYNFHDFHSPKLEVRLSNKRNLSSTHNVCIS